MSDPNLPTELQGLPANHVRVIDFLATRDPNRPMHARTDIAIAADGKQTWKSGP